MGRPVALVLALSFLTALARAAAQDASGEPVELRLRFAAGDRWASDEEASFNAKVKILADGKPLRTIEQTRRLVEKSELTVLAVDGEKIAAVRARYAPECSEVKETAGAAAPEKKMPGYAGQTVTVRRQPRGEPSIESAAPLSDEERKRLAKLVEPDAGFHPKKPVKPGDRWVADNTALARAFELGSDDGVTMRLRLKGVCDHEGRRAAEVDAAIVIYKKEQFLKITLDLEGTLVLDLETGAPLLVDVRGPITVTGETEQQGPDGRAVKLTADGSGDCALRQRLTKLPPEPAGGAKSGGEAAPDGWPPSAPRAPSPVPRFESRTAMAGPSEAELAEKLAGRPDLFWIQAAALAAALAVGAAGLVVLCRFLFRPAGRREPQGIPASAAWSAPEVALLALAFLAAPPAVVAAATLFGAPAFEPPDLRSEHVTLLMGAHALVAAIAVMIAVVRRRRGLQALGLPGPAPLSAARAGLVACIGVFPLVHLARFLTTLIFRSLEKVPDLNPTAAVLVAEDSLPRVIAIAIGAAIVVPITEEILFRGVLYAAIRNRAGPGVAILLSAGIFAVVHPRVDAAAIVVFAIVLAGVYEKTGSLVAPIVAHTAHNAFAVALLLVERYIQRA